MSTYQNSTRQRPTRLLNYTTDQWVPFPLPQVFAFFSDPRNLPRLMPRWQDACIDNQELQPAGLGAPAYAAGPGSRILLSFRPVPLSPIRLHWLAMIDDYKQDQGFCDLQLDGPFGYWRHCHHVAEEVRHDTPGTLITDSVDYCWPVGPFSPIVDALGGRLQIRQVFRFRKQQVLRMLIAAAQ